MNKQFFSHNLCSLLDLSDSRIITFVGGGGKSSLMNTLGKEFARQSVPTLLTTTTHIMRPDFLPKESYIEEENFKLFTSFFANPSKKQSNYYLAALGIPEKIINGDIKWRSPSINFCEKIAEFSLQNSQKPLKILCEGDGAKRHPIKLPKDKEPVFFPQTDTVIGVIGLSCLGKPVKETLFRYELLNKLLCNDETLTEIINQENCITTNFLYWLCLSQKGLLKNITSQKFCIVLNQADILDTETLSSVITLRNKIRDNGINCYITSSKFTPRIGHIRFDRIHDG